MLFGAFVDDVNIEFARTPDKGVPEGLAVRIFRTLTRAQGPGTASQLGDTPIAYDGQKIAIAKTKLEVIPDEGRSFEVPNLHATVTIKHAASIDMRAIYQYLHHQAGPTPNHPIDQIKALNIVFRDAPRESFEAFRRNAFFLPRRLDTVGNSVDLKGGYSITTRIAGNETGLVVNDKVALFRPEGPLLAYICAILGKNERAWNDTGGLMNASERARVSIACRGMKLRYSPTMPAPNRQPGANDPKNMYFPFSGLTEQSAVQLEFDVA
ncbi:hypothetical protein HDU93_008030, partial [Gonapodya sp. JEL0774]